MLVAEAEHDEAEDRPDDEEKGEDGCRPCQGGERFAAFCGALRLPDEKFVHMLFHKVRALSPDEEEERENLQRDADEEDEPDVLPEDERRQIDA